jgi:hypothetical protein
LALPARQAYFDYRGYSREHGPEPYSETRFGRILSAECAKLGGRKQKRRDRTYYVGFAIAPMPGIAEDGGHQKPAAFSVPMVAAHTIATM